MGQKNSLFALLWPSIHPDIRFATLGAVVLDELHFPLLSPMRDVIGGSGTYSTLGARVFSPKANSKSIGWIVRAGGDLPPEIRTKLESWNTNLLIVEDVKEKSTRGYLEYQDATRDKKIFRYLTPVLSTLPAHLSDTEILSSRSFHLLADPNELIEQIQQLLILRKVALIYDRPLIVWEPMPSSCIPANLNAFFKAVREVDVFSPNHVELGGIFGQPLQSQFDASQVERLALPFMTSGIGASRQGSVVVRAGEHGSFIASAMQPSTWLPAYYTQVDSGNEANGPSLKVIDPTGAGNAFLGAFAIGLLNTSSVFEAACYGTIGSSFALEQVGLPEISVSGDEELWNGESAMSRLNQYKQRLQNSAKRSLP